jgi:hypothetical protein
VLGVVPKNPFAWVRLHRQGSVLDPAKDSDSPPSFGPLCEPKTRPFSLSEDWSLGEMACWILHHSPSPLPNRSFPVQYWILIIPCSILDIPSPHHTSDRNPKRPPEAIEDLAKEWGQRNGTKVGIIAPRDDRATPVHLTARKPPQPKDNQSKTRIFSLEKRMNAHGRHGFPRKIGVSSHHPSSPIGNPSNPFMFCVFRGPSLHHSITPSLHRPIRGREVTGRGG